MDTWAYEHTVVLDCPRPEKPTDNGCIESLNGRFGDECLDGNGFSSLDEALRRVDAWRADDNAS
ncbi:MAG: transposase [Okeania sp. SIO3C4]|nr:transposase [Okeania sp. SIO3C4]